MPIIFASHVAKAEGTDELPELVQALRRFIADNQTALAEFLVRLWHRQENAVTYQQIREAILGGSVSEKQIAEWQQDYAKFIDEKLSPQWDAAMKTAAEQVEQAFPGFNYEPGAEAVHMWTEKHSGELVTNVTVQQRTAINTLVRRASNMKDYTVDELAHAIRPTVGLTKPQATANLNYYNTLRKNGMKPEKALDKSIKYAGKQHRYRAMSIARTELAMAYNNGEYAGIKQAQAEGFMGPVKKKWMTAGDGHVCRTCEDINGTELPLDELFPVFGGVLTPPAHPSCRCCLIYVEQSTTTELTATAAAE